MNSKLYPLKDGDMILLKESMKDNKIDGFLYVVGFLPNPTIPMHLQFNNFIPQNPKTERKAYDLFQKFYSQTG